ncbi:MAG TPA: carboxypeptidase-like regulatory domain-containing protein [Longimicrobium sp.]|nr:carboxypeptidase-like regulatory domain-containing protein [Longimicrobium sp.]
MMHRIRIPRRLAACLGVMLFVSCADPLGMCGCPPSLAEAVIYGRVTDAAGAPVKGARVRALLGASGCTAQLGVLGDGITAVDGRYRAHLATPSPPREGNCLRAYASPPAQGRLRGSDTVAFAVGFGTDRVADSTRVDLVLRAP